MFTRGTRRYKHSHVLKYLHKCNTCKKNTLKFKQITMQLKFFSHISSLEFKLDKYGDKKNIFCKLVKHRTSIKTPHTPKRIAKNKYYIKTKA